MKCTSMFKQHTIIWNNKKRKQKASFFLPVSAYLRVFTVRWEFCNWILVTIRKYCIGVGYYDLLRAAVATCDLFRIELLHLFSIALSLCCVCVAARIFCFIRATAPFVPAGNSTKFRKWGALHGSFFGVSSLLFLVRRLRHDIEMRIKRMV